MESIGNFTNSNEVNCMSRPQYLVFLSLIDVIPVLVGQPVIARMLWVILTSKKATDVLNCNLALFHNLQYLMSVVHFSVMFWLPNLQVQILRFLSAYTQMGGPMSLAFICMERYVAVIYPTSYPLLTKYRIREVCAVTVWLLSVPIALMNVLAAVLVSNEEGLKLFPVYVMVVLTSMVTHCSYSIARTLRKSGPGRSKLHPAKKRAFKTVCATAVITFTCYTPVTYLNRFRFVDEYLYVCTITPVCILLLSAASVVHPIFYLSAKGKMFSCMKRKPG